MRLTAVPGSRVAEHSNWPILSMIGAALLIAVAASLVTIGHLRDVVLAAAAAGQHIGPARLLHAIRPIDLALAAAGLAAIVGLVWLEMTRAALSRLLRSATPAQGLVLTLMLVAWTSHSFLFSGALLGGDMLAHVQQVVEVRWGLEAGHLPLWTNYEYLGSDLLEFTGPLQFVIGGALDLLIRDPFATVKLMLFATELLCAWAAFAWLRRLGLGQVPAMVGAVCFCGSFANLHMFFYRGITPQAFTLLFLLLAFHAAERMAASPRLFSLAWGEFVLATAGLILNHQPHGVFVAIYLAVFGGISLAQGRWRRAVLPPLASAGAFGVAIGLIAVVPVLVEGHWAEAAMSAHSIRLVLPSAAQLLKLVLWHHTRENAGPDSWAYLGIVFAALALAGVLTGPRSRQAGPRRQVALAALPCLALSLLLADDLVRSIVFILLFGSVFAAIGYAEVVERRGGRWLGLALVALLVLDLSSTAVQPVARPDKQFMARAGAYLAAQAPMQRVLTVTVGNNGGLSVDISPAGTVMTASHPLQLVAGMHNLAATHALNYAEATAKLAERDLVRSGRLSAATAQLLEMLDVSRVVCFASFRAGCPPSVLDAAPEGPLGRRILLPAATPVVFSRRLVAVTPAAGLDAPALWNEDFDARPPPAAIAGIDTILHRVAASLTLAPGRPLAAAILVRGASAETDGTIEGWAPRLLRYHVGLDRVRLTVETDRPAWVQLAHPWFPVIVVTVDGQRVRPLRSAMDLIVLPIAPGVSRIALAYAASPLRRATALFSGSAALLALGCVGGSAIRRRRDPLTG
ncbi:MAG TPA: 6-pyruvoyl-tetrahydropterin synthase-related protein [Acetobacteraceae bacterium]|nr:6-pyruvoyl-tetrahydropterin synthase-related protein [Acetobacteraceae bacterium]